MALINDVQDAINRHTAESASGTPDYILASYLMGCLTAFNIAVKQREQWHGRNDPQPTVTAQRPRPESEADPRNPTAPGHEGAGHTSPSTT